MKPGELPTPFERPPGPEEVYQSFVTCVENAGVLRALYVEAETGMFLRLGIDPGEHTPEQSAYAAANNTRDERVATFAMFHYWLGALQVAVEGWRSLCLADPEIAQLLSDTQHCDVLRRARNAIFHFQRSLRHSGYAGLYEQLTLVGPWAMELDNALGRFAVDHPTRAGTPESPSRAREVGELAARQRLASAVERLYEVVDSPDATADELRDQLKKFARAADLWTSKAPAASRRRPAQTDDGHRQ